MAMTFRRIDEIRKPLDKYKKEYPYCKTDSSAIISMVEQHHDLTKQLKQARDKIARLESKVDKYDTQFNALGSALAPFIRVNKKVDS